jgi:lipopolysaccharide export system permease protein
LREHAGPFVFAFVVIFFILVVDLLIDIMDAILGKGLDIVVVLELFILNFAWMVALAVPMAVLVAVLMAFGRMANDNEVVALMAAGESPLSLCVPVLVGGAIIAAGLVWFNNAVLPESNFRARVLRADVTRRKPAINLKDREGVFITGFPRHVLRIDKVHLDSDSPTGPITGSRLEGVVVYEYDDAGREPAVVITAESGLIELWQGGAVARLTLHDGEMIQVDADDGTRDLRTRFDTQKIIIEDDKRGGSGPSWTSGGHRTDREMSAAAMLVRVNLYKNQMDAANERVKNVTADTTLTPAARASQIRAESRLRDTYAGHMDRYMVEVHKKYSIPVASIVFVLIGAPLGMMARGSGRTASVAMSLVLFLLYWASLIGGEQLADRNVVQPWFAMWGANIIVGVFGIVLLTAVTHNVRIVGLLEALPRLMELKRFRTSSESDPEVDTTLPER